MSFIAFITIVTLVITGIFHFYWALGGEVGLDRAIPTKDGKALLNPGKFLTITVGFILLGFAGIAYVLNFKNLHLIPYSEQVVYAGWFLPLIFAIRCIGDFNTVGLFKKIKSTKFAEFDSKYFIPLTLFWSITFALLAYRV